MEWEGTLDSTNTIEQISDDTVITLQIHKRVWPTTQRDALFWSHIRHIPSKDESNPDVWIVCNYSTEHEKAPVNYYNTYFVLVIFCLGDCLSSVLPVVLVRYSGTV